MGSFGILVGGGPAPGINGVIGAAGAPVSLIREKHAAAAGLSVDEARARYRPLGTPG